MDDAVNSAIHSSSANYCDRPNKASYRTARITALLLAAGNALVSLNGCATSSGQGSPTLDALFGTNRPALDRYVQESQQQNALRDAQMRDLEARRQERETERRQEMQMAEILQNMETAWQAAGLSPTLAHAVATAYQPSSGDSSILAGVRERGSNSAVAPMFEAVKRYDYNLADQLLIALLIVRAEETKP